MNVAELLAEAPCTCLLHNCDLKDKQMDAHDAHGVIAEKVVALFFTSNWCEPCHTFRKTLAQSHKAMEKRSSEVVVINVPVESDPGQAKYCFEPMPASWYMIAPDSQQIKMLLNRYSVRTVPRLVVCKSDGTPITLKGRSEIESKMAGAAYNWVESARPKPKQMVNGFDLEELSQAEQSTENLSIIKTAVR